MQLTKISMLLSTMFQLRNLINRRNVRKDPSGDVNSSEDFIVTVVEGHILAAVMEALECQHWKISHFPPSSQRNHKEWSHCRGVNFYYIGCRLS